MVRVTEDLLLPAGGMLTLFSGNDVLLTGTPILVFHGSSTTTNSTQNSSRIQVHIVSAAGVQSYPRITISPNSSFYAAVNFLPRDKQGDEVYRGLAFALFKYFKELPEAAKSSLVLQSAASGNVAGAVNRGKRPGSAPSLFAEQHAADLASSMVRVENAPQVMIDLESALRSQNINHVDVDLVLPPGSIAPFEATDEAELDDVDEDDLLPDPTLRQYGVYARLVRLFGTVGFLPTSKLRRAPSKPSSLSRSRSFVKEQKVALRRDLSELIDTEERYVVKMHDLVNNLAVTFRQKSQARHVESSSPSTQELERLFPPSLDHILEINSAFLAAARQVMDDSEEDAMRDLESSETGSTGSRHGAASRVKDPTGALALSRVLLEYFPQFEAPYQQYMRASQEFPQIISRFTKQPSSFSQRVQQTGEQKLRSAIIEPVQRIPRYSLFIDNIIGHLPFNHPAIQPMLKARDIITQICSLDDDGDTSQVVNRLRNLVEAWPTSFYPKGRLITAVDFVELVPPYHINSSTTSNPIREGMLLLFADCVTILRKSRDCNISARGLMAEVDKPSATTLIAPLQAAAGGHKHVYALGFSGWHVLGDTRFTMSDDGSSIWMSSSHDLKDPFNGRDRSQAASVRQLYLQTNYDGKALKLTEEITKARIEGRFSEAERETDRWSLRQVKTSTGLSLHTAVFSEGIDTLMEGRREPCSLRVVIDHAKGTKGAPVGHYGVEIVANVTTMVEGERYRLEVVGLHNKVFIDEVIIEHLLPILSKRGMLETWQS